MQNTGLENCGLEQHQSNVNTEAVMREMFRLQYCCTGIYRDLSLAESKQSAGLQPFLLFVAL